MYYDDLDSLERDFAESDRQAGETMEWLRDELPWLTNKEHEVLRQREDFPGLFASCAELSAFVLKFKKGKSRMVTGKLESHYSVTVRADLVSGKVYLSDNGRYKECNLAGWLRIQIPMPPRYYPNSGRVQTRTFSNAVRSGCLDLVSSREMQSLVDDLEKANLLAPL